MAAHRRLHAIPGGRSAEAGAGNGRSGRVVAPHDDAAPPGTLTAELHKARPQGPVRLQLVGELDMASAEKLQRAIDVAWTLCTRTLVIDLRGVVFMDLTSVQVMLNAQREAAESDCRLAVIVSDAARHALQRTGVLTCFEVIDGP